MKSLPFLARKYNASRATAAREDDRSDSDSDGRPPFKARPTPKPVADDVFSTLRVEVDAALYPPASAAAAREPTARSVRTPKSPKLR